jgi:hypothetical protein
MRVVVVIFSNNSSCQLSSCFDSRFFEVFIRNIPVATSNRRTAELYRFREIVSEFSSCDFLVVLKDTCHTLCSKKTIVSKISSLLSVPDWDVAYLCRWLDRCDLNEEISRDIYSVKSPHGSQALIFSSDGIKRFLCEKPLRNGKQWPWEVLEKNSFSLSTCLNSAISKGALRAICITPNLFEFDIEANEKTETNLVKMTLCRRPETPQEENSGVIPFTWFLVIVLGIILFAWVLWYFGPKRNENIIEENK